MCWGASKCLHQQLLQLVQARRTPGFLPHSPTMLILFAFNIKCISSKTTTEPSLPAGCELGCSRAAQSVTSWCLSSYFWAVSVPCGRWVGRYCTFPSYFGSQAYAP